jgi:hypothetical protein
LRDGVGAEVVEGGEGFLECLANGNAAPHKGVECLGILDEGLAEGEIRVGVGGVLVEVGEEFDLGAVETAEAPNEKNDLVDVGALLGVGGLEVGVELGFEGVVGGDVLGGEAFRAPVVEADPAAITAVHPIGAVVLFFVGHLRSSPQGGFTTATSRISDKKYLNR